MRAALQRYVVYGLTVYSDQPLTLPVNGPGHLGAVRLESADGSFFEDTLRRATFHSDPHDWYRYASVEDGSSYVEWGGVGEFVVSSDGTLIRHRRSMAASLESFQVYALGQALSFALVRQGHEPLHATAVIVDGRAVALFGMSGYGKSTLAASFVRAGHAVLTDDLLVLTTQGRRVFAYPGPSRLKLFAKAAASLLPSAGPGVPMNADTKKLVFPLAENNSGPVELSSCYDLTPPSAVRGVRTVQIGATGGRDATMAIMRAAFNKKLAESARLSQHFAAATALAQRVPVRTLAYPRILRRLPEVVAAIATDIEATVPCDFARAG